MRHCDIQSTVIRPTVRSLLDGHLKCMTLRAIVGLVSTAFLLVPSSMNAQTPCLSASQTAESRHNPGLTADRTVLSEKTVKRSPSGNNHGIIYDTPEGRLRYYTKNSAGFCYDWSGIEQFRQENAAASIVFGENNDVYIYDILPKAEYGCWIKGEISGNEITVRLPQNVFYTDAWDDDYDAYYVQAYRMKMIEDGVSDEGDRLVRFVVDEDRQDITFTIDSDSRITMEDDAVIGTLYSDNLEWTGNCEYMQQYEVFPYDTVKIPEGIEIQKWSFLYENPEISYDGPDEELHYILRGHLINVGINGDDIYFQGFFPDMPQTWVKGHIDGNRVTVSDRQFMGQFKSHNIFLMFATVNPGPYGLEYSLTDGPFEFEFDPQARILRPVSTTSWMVNSMFDRVLYAAAYSAPYILYEPLTATTPADPIPYIFYEYDIDYGDGTFEFIMPNYNIEGKLLDTDFYYYNVFIDGELFTFVRDTYLGEYVDLEVPEITDVPYSLNTSYIYKVEDNIHGFSFFIDGFKTIGIQTVYNYGGVECRSNLITYHVDTNTATNDGGATQMSAVGSMSDAAKSLKSVEYYTVDGRLATPQSKGLLIKKSMFEDGSVRTEKIVTD